MKYNQLANKAKHLQFDKPETIYTYLNTSIIITRPSMLSKRFRHYDINKNFQIWLYKGEINFRPSHLRILIDLKLRVMAMPAIKNLLLESFDKIFYGEDPLAAIHPLKSIEFVNYIEPLPVIANLAQIMLIEQEIGYGSRSTFEPPSLYLQGWIRTFLDSDKEIDELVYRLCRNTPPSPMYTSRDDRNHIKYEQNASPLWYI
ncbi:MAG: hypothetical protein ACI3XC_02275 [Phascolarctobacterium sp.]